MAQAAQVINLAARRPEVTDQQKRPRMSDGFVAIPNGIIDSLFMADLTGNQFKLAVALARKTFGFGKTADDITIAQLARQAGIRRSEASPAFDALVSKRIITASKGTHGYLTSFNEVSFWDIEPSEIPTPVVNADGRSSEIPTHNIQPQQTTDIPPVVPPQRKARRKGAKVTLATFITACKERGERFVEEGDVVTTWARGAGIPDDMLGLACRAFIRRYCDDPNHSKKTYVDWRATLRNAVEGNWMKVWAAQGDSYVLTTVGVSMKRELENRHDK